MSSRSNKKRKPRKDPTNRERTVTTLTGAPNTEYLVPIPSEEPPNFNGTSKMQGAMSQPYPVQHSPNFQFHSGRPSGGNPAGYSAFDPMNNVQHIQPQQNSFYGPSGAQRHQQPAGQPAPANTPTTSTWSQDTKPPQPPLPPGKNDLEILENLKRLIKEGQHPFFRAVPQPAALASLYKGTIPVSDPKNGESSQKTSTTATQKDSEPVQTVQATTEGGRGAASFGDKAVSNDRDRYLPASQPPQDLSMSTNGASSHGAPPTSAGSSYDSRRDNGRPPPGNAFFPASTDMPTERQHHDEPYDPTRSREYYAASLNQPRPDSVYERPPAGYPNAVYNGHDSQELPRHSSRYPPPQLPRRANRDGDFDSRHPSDIGSLNYGPPDFLQGNKPNSNGLQEGLRTIQTLREQMGLIGLDSQPIPDLAPDQTDPADLLPLIQKAREEKRKNRLLQGDADGAAMTTTESRPLPTGTMPTEGASTLRESEIPSAQRAAEAAVPGDVDIQSSRASSRSPRITQFVIPVPTPIIPIAGIDVPMPEKKPIPDEDPVDDGLPIKIERPPYGRQFYGSLPPGETALDVGELIPLFHELKQQGAIRKGLISADTEAASYAPSTSSAGRGGGGPPQDYPPGPDPRRHPPQDNMPPDSGLPPHPPARFESRERERYPRDARDTRDSRDVSPASHVPRRYPPGPPPVVSPPGSVRSSGSHPHDGPDRDRDRDWQYHQHSYPRRERWGDHWDPSESYSREYPPPPPRSAGWDSRDREYPPRDYPHGPPLDDRDRSYAPPHAPHPMDERRERPPAGPYNPPYGRVRHRSPSPPPVPRRPGGPPQDDLRPPTKRSRDEYGDYYTPAPPPPPRDLPPPHRRGAGDHYPPLPTSRAVSPHHGPPGPSSWAPPTGGGPMGDRDRDRDMRGRDYRPGPMEYPPPHHGHPHMHDGYRPRSPPHGPPPPGPPRPYGRGGYGGGRGDRYPPPRP